MPYAIHQASFGRCSMGRDSVAGDFALEAPPVLGTQHRGPDPANVSKRQSNGTRNLIYLYNPRSIVSTSGMLGYPWYFVEKEQMEPGDLVVPVPDAYKPAGIDRLVS